MRNPVSRKLTSNRFTGALVMGLGIALVVTSRAYPYKEPFGPGPGLWPLILGLGLVMMGAIICFWAKDRETPASDHKGNPLAVLATLMAIGVFILIYEPAGLILSTFAIVFALTLVGRPGASFLRTGLFAVVIAMLIWILFRLILGLQLPRGILGI